MPISDVGRENPLKKGKENKNRLWFKTCGETRIDIKYY